MVVVGCSVIDLARKEMNMRYHTQNINFLKTGAEIKEKAKLLVEKRRAKVEERKRLVAEQAKALGIESVEDALTRAEEIGLELTDPDQNIAHSKMLSNRSKVKEEQAEIRQLETLIRNLDEDRSFELTFDDLEYYGF